MLSACKSATCASGFDKVEFAYDGEANRTQIKTTTAAGAVATRDFRYQDDAIVEEVLTDATHTAAVVRSYVVDESGTVVKMTVAAGEPGADVGSSVDYIPVWNGHGDAVSLSRLNADGTLTLANSYRYETWGKPTTATHNSIPDLGFRFLYVGEFDVQWDDQLGLGLAYMHARHYSPALGRFLQPDPDRSEANLYAYAGNSPVTEMDPDGTCFIVCQLVVGAVIDSVIYLATTENASLGGLAHAVVGGAVESAINPLAKVNKVFKLAKAAHKVLTKVPKASRAAKRIAPKTRPRLARPGEDLYVGPYSVSRAANKRTGLNRTHTPHHAPQNARSGVSHSRGITINLRRDLHERTGTYRRPARNLPSRRSHLAADVRELRGILRDAGYERSVRNRQLQELIRQNKALWRREFR